MKESDYINATNLAKARMADRIIRDMLPDDINLTDKERAHVLRCLGAWEARLERAVSPETRRENKEPERMEWPIS